MTLTHDHIQQKLTSRRLVAFFLSRTSQGTWAANARSEGAALVVAAGGATPEEATYAILETPQLPAGRVKPRYFVGADADLAVTYNGAAPLQSDGGSWREVSAAEWTAARQSFSSAPPPARDEYADLLGL